MTWISTGFLNENGGLPDIITCCRFSCMMPVR